MNVFLPYTLGIAYNMSEHLYQWIHQQYLGENAPRGWRDCSISGLVSDIGSNRKGKMVIVWDDKAYICDWDKPYGNSVRIYGNLRGIRKRIYRSAKLCNTIGANYLYHKNYCFRYMDIEDYNDYLEAFGHDMEAYDTSPHIL